MDEYNDELLPKSCSRCGGQRLARIIWRCVYLYGQDKLDVESGKAVLAGPIANGTLPWACLDCEPRWNEINRMALQDLAWQIEKEESLALEDFDVARNFLDAQKEIRGNIASLLSQISDNTGE